MSKFKYIVAAAVVAATFAGLTVTILSLGGGSPTPRYAPRPKHAEATLTMAAALAHLPSELPTGNTTTKGTAHAEQQTFGKVNALKHALSGRYAPDYPVWVVAVSGQFETFGGPPGTRSTVYDAMTLYLDGYTGERILVEFGSHERAPATSAAPVPVRDMPVIDTATATQDVVNTRATQPGTIHAVLTTFGTIPAAFATRYASSYPVWVLTAAAAPADQIHGTQPTVMTFYVDGYSGRIILLDKQLASTEAPAP